MEPHADVSLLGHSPFPSCLSCPATCKHPNGPFGSLVWSFMKMPLHVTCLHSMPLTRFSQTTQDSLLLPWITPCCSFSSPQRMSEHGCTMPFPCMDFPTHRAHRTHESYSHMHSLSVCLESHWWRLPLWAPLPWEFLSQCPVPGVGQVQAAAGHTFSLTCQTLSKAFVPIRTGTCSARRTCLLISDSW